MSPGTLRTATAFCLQPDEPASSGSGTRSESNASFPGTRREISGPRAPHSGRGSICGTCAPSLLHHCHHCLRRRFFALQGRDRFLSGGQDRPPPHHPARTWIRGYDILSRPRTRQRLRGSFWKRTASATMKNVRTTNMTGHVFPHFLRKGLPRTELRQVFCNSCGFADTEGKCSVSVERISSRPSNRTCCPASTNRTWRGLRGLLRAKVPRGRKHKRPVVSSRSARSWTISRVPGRSMRGFF